MNSSLPSKLKLVREEAGTNSLARIINVQHPMDQNIYMKEDAVDRNYALMVH